MTASIHFKGLLLSAALAAMGSVVIAQTAAPATPMRASGPTPPTNPTDIASLQIHDREMAMLGLTKLRNCNSPLDPSDPLWQRYSYCDDANWDEALANPYPLPDPLIFANGRPVKTAADWKKRRTELFELFDREVYGRVPKRMPRVTWHLDDTVHESIGGIAVITKKLTGHVDNRIDPAITVDIKMNVTVPEEKTAKHIPAVMSFGSTAPPRAFPLGAGRGLAPAAQGPDYRQQILSRGWGLVILDNASIQVDNGAGLTAGIIGLMNKDGSRKPDDWGALRAWAWGASRGLDYLATDPDINVRKVGIFGHSRNGKAALVAEAYDSRFAIGFISSSGAVGAAPYRRNYGESIANVETAGEFHWMAPNFMKYASVDSSPDKVPVDAPELLALVAPRPMFIGGGTFIPPPGPNRGDAWIDPPGSFIAARDASKVYRLLGKTGVGTDTVPPVMTEVATGEIAFRQHDGGHTPNPNWPYFLDFAAKYFD